MDCPADWHQWTADLARQAHIWGWRCRQENLLELELTGAPQTPRCYLSAGIHGDEPAGPLAVAALLEDIGCWAGWQAVCFPALNIWGLQQGCRQSEDGNDLNRDYARARSGTTVRHLEQMRHLRHCRVAICLHEDWEAGGSYLYYLHRDGSVVRAREVLAAMARHIPTETAAQIDGRSAEEGLIHRHPDDFEGDALPEAIYLARHHADYCYTLETPSSLPLAWRVGALVAGVKAILRAHHGPNTPLTCE